MHWLAQICTGVADASGQLPARSATVLPLNIDCVWTDKEWSHMSQRITLQEPGDGDAGVVFLCISDLCLARLQYIRYTRTVNAGTCVL
jgi:hypothetical protein